MKTQGADLTPFEKSPEQVAYENAVSAWQQQMQLVVEAIQKSGQPFDPAMLPPQPLPAQFGYDPKVQGSSAAAAPTIKTTVNNITRNVSEGSGGGY